MIKCEKNTTFEECEMAVLRSTIDKIDKKKGEELISNPEINKIINIVETFIKKNKLVCYGGTAINNILPDEDKFYNKNDCISANSGLNSIRKSITFEQLICCLKA